MLSRLALLLALLLCLGLGAASQPSRNSEFRVENEGLYRDTELEGRLQNYFATYQTPFYRPNTRIGLSSYRLDTLAQTLDVVASEGFGSQNFTPALVDSIYRQFLSIVPEQYADYRLTISSMGREIGSWIANLYNDKTDSARTWREIEHTGRPHIVNISRPYSIGHGLEGCHLALWASHGLYYSHEKEQWQWQRPALYCSMEDLLTPTIAYTYLAPMLEQAGAIIFSPRERDTQARSVIIDNDGATGGHAVLQERLHHWQTSPYAGYTEPAGVIIGDQNPMNEGTALIIRSVDDETQTSTIRWLPTVEEEDNYAVYVVYQSFRESTEQAVYEIVHSGVRTRVAVNQQMGGGIWTYLGTFHFTPTDEDNNYIELCNLTPDDGIVSADAVRLGGGMGIVARGDSATVSGMPAFMEGARTAVQAMGFPSSVYDTKDGRNDYADDINSRSRSLNYLSGGSQYNPDTTGLGVPIELSVAIHTDAGQRDETDMVGTLCISTPADEKGDSLLASGISRMASSDLAAIIQHEVCQSMRSVAPNWPERELYHRNYSETRLPRVPSVIVELLSHQNFADCRLVHSPKVQFRLARAVYKGILRFIGSAHNRDVVVQPLPPSEFKALLDGQGGVRLSWKPTRDELEPTAEPTSYVVYTQKEGQDWDNGRLIERTYTTIEIEPGTIYNFKVCALNDGGLSFPTDQLAAMWNPLLPDPELIVAQYPELRGPEIVSTSDSLGFVFTDSAPVPYGTTYEYVGFQTNYSRNSSSSGESNLQFVTEPLVGNTYDMPLRRGREIKATTGRSFHSCGLPVPPLL